MTDIEATLLGAVIGGAIGVIGTYLGTIQTAKKSRRADANIAFYEVFRKAIRDLQSTANPPTEPQHTLNSHIEDHRSAAYRFKFFLEGDERNRFLAAWEGYYKKYKKQEFADNGERDKRREKIQLALDLIHKLLVFAGYEKND
ncbi:MAG: hypothetical protein Q8M34_08425 [Thermodesulfovibrionales bacterium]|nr:hypothetical protein [Thermodesulfovibrionales bacterium]